MNRVATRMSVVCLALILTAPAPARAQELEEPGPRQGYYLGVAMQAARSDARDAEIGAMHPMWGGGASIRMGQMLTRWVGLGLQINTALTASPRWQAMQGGLLLDAQIVPISTLVLRLGAGLGAIQLHDRQGRTDEVKGTGGACYNAAVSYDLFPWIREPSGGLSVAPVVQVSYLPGDSFHAWSVWAGVELLWWFGLPRNQLDLPVDEAFAR